MNKLSTGLLLLLVLAVPAVATLLLYRNTVVPAPVVAPTRARSAGPRLQLPALPQEAAAGLTLTSRDEDGGREVRGFAHLALAVPEGEAPSMLLEPGPFDAVFRGTLKIPTRDRYRFTIVGTGSFQLRIGDKEVLRFDGGDGARTSKAFRLKKGVHPLRLDYRSPPAGPAQFRVYWQSRDFGREPIPARSLSHEAPAELAAYDAVRRGYHLVAEHRCGRCHSGEELGRGAPALVAAGSRFRPAWLKAWIADPQALRPGTTMPKMLHGTAPVVAREAADLAAYLGTLGKAPEPLAFDAEQVETGGLLFADSGCIACHTLPDHQAAPSGTARIPLDLVGEKFYPAALAAYLREPEAHHGATRMPNYGLDEGQSRALAAFLLSRQGRTLPASPVAGDPARGAELAARRGCAACHGMPVQNRLEAGPDAVRADGSVACTAAGFGLSDSEQAALREYLLRRHDRARPLRVAPTPVDLVEHEMHATRCVHCHRWNSGSTLLEKSQSEVAPLLAGEPQEGVNHGPPDLTFAGAKLRSGWLTRWLAGKAPSPRPWMHMKMPVFAIPPARFAAGLARRQGYPVSTATAASVAAGTEVAASTVPVAEEFESLADLADALGPAGRKLVERDGGLGCVQCHSIRDRAAEEVFEAPGINLALTPERLRKEFYHRWVLDPQRIDPGTKMTRFGGQDGETGLRTILEGRAQAQFEAIWVYLQSVAK